MRANALDHVALWVSRRHEIADFLCVHCGMHEIDRQEEFTLVGADARRGKITLFDAEGPREPGALERIVLRVGDLERAVGELPADLPVERTDEGIARFEAPEGVGLGLVEDAAAPGPDYDLDHVVLRVPDPDGARGALAQLGFGAADGRLRIADKHLRLVGGGAPEGERPLLNHLALLVDSAADVEAEARRRDLDVVDVVDAANTLAVFLWGPSRIKLEYVEHKPGFALA